MAQLASIGTCLLLAVVLAGCGSSGRSFDRDATAACIASREVVESVSTKRSNLDFIGQAARGGGIYVLFLGGNEAYVSFEQTADEVGRAYDDYTLPAGALIEPIGAGVRRVGNVVFAFDQAPTRSQVGAVSECLRG